MHDLVIEIDKYFSNHNIAPADIAVGVSGGADSMALCFALSEYFAEKPDIVIHAITVDHGLRQESADEALYVAEQLNNLSNVKHHILQWRHDNKPNARIQELARNARYELMYEFMAENGVAHLFLGQHMDDQAETFLFRLAKGSGVDGLACMAEIQKMKERFLLCRPMLKVSKAELIEFCERKNIDFINDPSNDSGNFARVRIRKSMEVLSAEGLTPKRLSVCAYRHARARAALELMAGKSYNNNVLEIYTERIIFNLSGLISEPEEMILRVVLRAMNILSDKEGYGARMDRVENLCADLLAPKYFRKRTLGGIIFECDVANNKFILCIE